MIQPSPPPDDNTLREFLLGTLPSHRADQVQAWLESDPTHAARFEGLAPSDALTASFSALTVEDSIPASAVERVIRLVSASLPRAGAEATAVADTLDSPDSHATVTAELSGHMPRDWPPKRLGAYRILRELGRGGMGYVFEAEDETLARRVALKVLKPDVSNRPRAAARFLREARAAARVEHENVVPVLHIGEDAGTSYLVMPLLKGESLAARLRRVGRLSVPEVVRLGRDVAAGLAAAHAMGLVHRDMKPANVWLDEVSGRARVLDFGLARLSDGGDALTDTGALAGTPAYLAPEVIDGLPATVSSDLFGLGAMLYECTTGKGAFTGPTVTAILKAVAFHHPPPPTEIDPSLPPSLSALILKLLDKYPAGRPRAAGDVIAALNDILQVDGRETTEWHDQPENAPRVSRRRLWQAAAAIVVSGLIGVTCWLGLVVSREPPAQPPPSQPDTVAASLPPVSDPPNFAKKDSAPVVARYRGKIDVRIARKVEGADQFLRLNEAGALPLTRDDQFRIDAEVEPVAYLYVVWVDPDHDVTPVYPWDAAKGWGTRPLVEEPVGTIHLPRDVGNAYTASKAKPGVATMVLFARPTPLDVADDVVKGWFETLPDLPLPPGGNAAAAWFDDFVEARDPLRLRTFGEVGSKDAFANWQAQLKTLLGGRMVFQTAVSFARTGVK